jgi:hypothetical protein
MTSTRKTDSEALRREILDAVGDENLAKYMLVKRVEEETQTYLNKRWKIVTTIGAIILTLVGVLGYKQFVSFKEIKEQAESNARVVALRAKEIDEKAKELDARNKELEREVSDIARRAEAAKQDAKDAKDDSRKLIDSTRDSANQAYGVITNSVGMLNDMYKNMGESQKKLAETQEQIDQQLHETEGRATKITQDQKLIMTQLKETGELKGSIEKDAAGFAEQYRIVEGQVQEVKDLGSVQKQLSQARTLELVMLRTNHSSNFRLIDFDGQKKTREYEVKFYTERLRRPYHITVNVERDSKGNAVSLNCDDINVDEIYRIDGTPFVFKVDFVYHSIWSRDFIALKVIHEGVLPDKAKVSNCQGTGTQSPTKSIAKSEAPKKQ